MLAQTASSRGTRFDIALGAHAHVAAYLAAFKESGHVVTGPASQMLRAVTFRSSRAVVGLVRVRLRDLGIIEMVSVSEAIDWGRRYGFFPCPDEVGPALRLALTSQPAKEWLTVAMEPLLFKRKSHVFCVDALGTSLELRSTDIEALLPITTEMVFSPYQLSP